MPIIANWQISAPDAGILHGALPEMRCGCRIELTWLMWCCCSDQYCNPRQVCPSCDGCNPKDNLPLAIWLQLRKDLRQKHRPYTPRIAECMGVELPGAWRHLDAKSSADFGTFQPLQDLPAMKAISLTPAIYYDYKGYHGYCCLLLIYDAMITYDCLFSIGAVMFDIVFVFLCFRRPPRFSSPITCRRWLLGCSCLLVISMHETGVGFAGPFSNRGLGHT